MTKKELREIEEFNTYMVEQGELAYKLLFHILNQIQPKQEYYKLSISQIREVLGYDIESRDLSYLCFNLLKVSSTLVSGEKDWAHCNIFQMFGYDHGILTVGATDIGVDIMLEIRRRLADQNITLQSLLENRKATQ